MKGRQQRTLYMATKNMETDEVVRLLQLGVSCEGYRDPRDCGATTLIAACIHGYTDIVRLLLEKGADVEVMDDYGRTPLMHAALHAQPEIVSLLVAADARLEAQDLYHNTPLFSCFSRFFVGFAWDVDFAGRNRQVARILLEAGADIQAKDVLGVNVLTWSWINTQLEFLFHCVLPHHLYHCSMYDMLWQHMQALDAAKSSHLSTACAA
jgi:ankyrin repeat protein